MLGQDLRRIRAAQSVSLDEIYEVTRISPHVLEQLEEDVLNHPLFNGAYLPPLLKQLAGILELDEETVMEAYDRACEGCYTNQLAAAYLEEEPIEVSEAPSEEDELKASGEVKTAAEDLAEGQEAVSGTEECEPVKPEENVPAANQQVVIPETGTLWPAVAMVMLAALVLTGIGLLVVGQDESDSMQAGVIEAEPYTAPALEQIEPAEPLMEEAIEEEAADEDAVEEEVTLGDSIQVDIVATHDRVDPIRVRVDDDLRRPYWIEEADSVRFRVSDRIVLEERLDRVRLLVEGFEYPMEEAGPEGPLTITREEAKTFLEEQVSAGLIGELRAEG